MDKKIWLKVIKEELAILEQLAIGMIDDATLSKEEVEVAITRSKIIVQEFELLLHHIPTQLREEITQVVERKVVSEAPISAPPEAVGLPSFVPPGLLTIAQDLPYGSLSENDHAGSPPHLPVSPSSVPPVKGRPQGIATTLSPTYSLPVPPSPEPMESNVLSISDQVDVPSQFKSVPLKSLKEGLSLNDRYLFQRELFNNDKSKLDETVATLDHFSNIREAVDYLKSNFKWTKSEASEKFVQLVKRRFS